MTIIRRLCLLLAFAFAPALADPRKDSTAELRALLHAASPGSTIRLPAGEHWVSVDASGIGLSIPPGVTVDARGTTIRLIENDRTGYFVIAMGGDNSHLLGGTIIGDRERHQGTKGEWGMCIGVRGADNVSIRGTHVRDCWGDGIYVGTAPGSEKLSRNVTIEGVDASYNRRNNISLVGVDGFRVSNVRLHKANGHPPEAGIDLEPNRGGMVINGSLTNIEATANVGRGVVFGAGKGEIRNVKLTGIRSMRNGQDGLWVQQASSIEAIDITTHDNGANGIAFISVTDARLVNFSTERNKAPIFFRKSHVQFR